MGCAKQTAQAKAVMTQTRGNCAGCIRKATCAKHAVGNLQGNVRRALTEIDAQTCAEHERTDSAATSCMWRLAQSLSRELPAQKKRSDVRDCIWPSNCAELSTATSAGRLRRALSKSFSELLVGNLQKATCAEHSQREEAPQFVKTTSVVRYAEEALADGVCQVVLPLRKGRKAYEQQAANCATSLGGEEPDVTIADETRVTKKPCARKANL